VQKIIREGFYPNMVLQTKNKILTSESDNRLTWENPSRLFKPSTYSRANSTLPLMPFEVTGCIGTFFGRLNGECTIPIDLYLNSLIQSIPGFRCGHPV